MPRLVAALIVIVHVIATTTLVTMAQLGVPGEARPGPLGGGVTLLPNGWRIAAAGKHMAIGDLPLNMVLSPDGRYLVVANAGYTRPTLRVVDLDRTYLSSTVPLDDAWYGLAWHPKGTKLYSSGAAANSVIELGWQNGRLTRHATMWLARRTETVEGGGHRPEPTPQTFVGGVAVSPDGRSIVAVHVLGQAVSLIDTATGMVRATAQLPAEPYTALFSRDGSTVFISLWGGAKVLRLDPQTLEVRDAIEVGEHPNAMVQAADGRLFVACANTNAVWVIDTTSQKPVEQIGIAAQRGCAVTRRRAPRGRQRGQQRGGARGRLDCRQGGCKGVHPDRLVSDRRPLQPHRRRVVRAERQGHVGPRESSRGPAWHQGR
jgi:hypothetical protein